MRRIIGISTTTHTPNPDHPMESASVFTLQRILEAAKELYNAEVEYIDAHKLHIVENLSCYSTHKTNCGGLDAGPYRCWAHKLSLENPALYGGVDEMPVIYDAIERADTVIFATSVRWMSHNAVLQKIIERLNTLENRHSVFIERNPLEGKKAGVLVVGQHYQAQQVSSHLVEVFSQLGFDTDSSDGAFTWQRTLNRHLEQIGPNAPHINNYMDTHDGQLQLKTFLSYINS